MAGTGDPIAARWPLAAHNRLILRHLRSGDGIQRTAARSVERTGVLRELKPYSPLIVGTMPIDVHLLGSYLDIVCCVRSPDRFSSLLIERFYRRPFFELHRTKLQKRPAVVCRFRHHDTLFEIVGMPAATSAQQAYIHLMVEADLLRIGGRPARAAICRLKYRGFATEPAFALYFGLAGEPYQAVAKLWRGIDRPLDLDAEHLKEAPPTRRRQLLSA